jgi:hypothetical protein
VRRIQPAQPVYAREQVGSDAVYDLADLAVHIRMQAAEVGDSRCRAHAPQKAVALDEQCRSAGAGRGDCRGYAGRAAAQDDHFVFPQHRVWRLGSVRVVCMGLKLKRFFGIYAVVHPLQAAKPADSVPLWNIWLRSSRCTPVAW